MFQLSRCIQSLWKFTEKKTKSAGEQAEDAGLRICTAASGGQDCLFFPKIIEKLQ